MEMQIIGDFCLRKVRSAHNVHLVYSCAVSEASATINSWSISFQQHKLKMHELQEVQIKARNNKYIRVGSKGNLQDSSCPYSHQLVDVSTTQEIISFLPK